MYRRNRRSRYARLLPQRATARAALATRDAPSEALRDKLDLLPYTMNFKETLGVERL